MASGKVEMSKRGIGQILKTSNVISDTAGRTYTATCDCWLYVFVVSNGGDRGNGIVVDVNDIRVFTQAPVYDTRPKSFTCPIKAGDVVKFALPYGITPTVAQYQINEMV